MQYTPITLGTLHIDMAIKLDTEEELKTLNKQWQRSLVATKLTMKEAQVLNMEETQIVSKLDSNVKIVKDTTIGPFETIEAKGILRKTPNHYKRINVVHVEASQVIPPLDGSLKKGDIYKKVTKDIAKENQSKDSPEKDDE